VLLFQSSPGLSTGRYDWDQIYLGGQILFQSSRGLSTGRYDGLLR